MIKTVIGIICLFVTLALAQDMYIGPYEAKAQFDSISADKLNRIRHQRVLFGSRSWGLAVSGSYVSDLGSNYQLNWPTWRTLAGTDTIPDNAFNSPGVIHFRQPDNMPARWTEFADIIRGRNGYKEFGPEIDIAFQFLYGGNGMWPAYHPLFDSLRREYPNIKFGICTHHMASDSTHNMDWNVYGNQYSDSVMATYPGEVPVLDIRMIVAICSSGDTATFQYQGKTYPQMCPAYSTPDHIHLQDYTTLCKGFYMMLDHLTPDTGYVDTTSLPVDSGMVTVYVDPTASGTGNGSSWQNAYTSLAAAILMHQGNLVAQDISITFQCRGGADVSSVTFNPALWTVDKNHYITVYVAPQDRHNGTRNTGYRLVPSNKSDFPFYLQVPYTVINGVAINAYNLYRYAMYISADSCRVLNCLLYDSNRSGYHAISLSSGSDGTILANNTIYSCAANGMNISYCYNTCLYNNTILNCGRALGLSNHTTAITEIKNCYFGSVAGDSLIRNGQSMAGVHFTTTHTSSGEYGTTVTATATNAGARFVNVTAGAENAHIQTGSALYTTGTDLGADPVYPFSYDAAGEFRNVGAYAVGAYELSTTTYIGTAVPGADFAPQLNVRYPVYDINGAPVLGKKKAGVYLLYDKAAGKLRKVLVLQ
jgi:hypothetical protein